MLHTTAQDLSIFIVFMKQQPPVVADINLQNSKLKRKEEHCFNGSEKVDVCEKLKKNSYPVIEMNGSSYLFSIKVSVSFFDRKLFKSLKGVSIRYLSHV